MPARATLIPDSTRQNHCAEVLAHYFCCDYSATVEAAERAIRTFPDFPSPYRWLAAALGELGRTAEAKDALQKAISVSSTSFEFQVHQRPPWFRFFYNAQTPAGI